MSYYCAKCKMYILTSKCCICNEDTYFEKPPEKSFYGEQMPDIFKDLFGVFDEKEKKS